MIFGKFKGLQNLFSVFKEHSLIWWEGCTEKYLLGVELGIWCISLGKRWWDPEPWFKPWKILKETGIPDHLTCLLRNLYASQEATDLHTGHGTTDWFQIGKGVRQGCILSPCLFNFYAEYIMRNVGLEETLESRLPGEISITSDMQMTPPLWQKVKRN